MASIKKLFKHHPTQEQSDMNAFAKAVQADNDGLRASFVALTAKMDADFTDVLNASVDYASSVNPAANTLVD